MKFQKNNIYLVGQCSGFFLCLFYYLIPLYAIFNYMITLFYYDNLTILRIFLPLLGLIRRTYWLNS